MTEQTANDKRVEIVKDRLQDDLVDKDGHPAEPGEVERVVHDKAAPFTEAPVQEFVPLLIEHEARDELRTLGLRRDFGDELEGEEPPT